MGDSRFHFGSNTNSFATGAVASSRITAERNNKDSSVVKNFYEEYQQVIKNARYNNYDLTLMDLLE